MYRESEAWDMQRVQGNTERTEHRELGGGEWRPGVNGGGWEEAARKATALR